MVEEQPATRARGNVKPGGRYGTAPDDAKHVEPEVAPVGVESAEVNVPDAIPGALPENAARRAGDEDEPK